MISNTKRDTDNHAMKTAMKAADKNGLWMEFGVFEGNTLEQMSDAANDKIIYAFDSFTGLPERWRNVSYNPNLEKYVKKTAFDRKGVPPLMKKHNIAFVIGLFQDTLPPFIKDNSDKNISFLHIDSDIYSSAYFVLKNVRQMLYNQSIIVFDELVNYPEYKSGEMKALWNVFKQSEYAIELVAHSCDKIYKNPKKDIWPQAVALRIYK
jgi:hypothetical protein